MNKYCKKGLIFETEAFRSLGKIFPFVVKLPDTRTLRFKKKIIEQVTGKNFHQVTAAEVPFDFICVREGKSYAFECKMTTKHRFQFAALKQHQENGLLNHWAAGGQAYVMINFRSADLRKVDSYNEVFAIHIVFYMKLKEKFKASVPKEFFEQNFKIHKEIKIDGERGWLLSL